MKSQESTASHADVCSLKEAGIIDAEIATQASALLRQTDKREHWLDFIRRGLLGLGLGHLMSGAVFFFAGNWALLSKWERLLPVLVLMLLSGAVAWLRNDALVGQLSLTVATVLVGVFMAVFGQVYQTGADAWTLFANWAALSLVWVAASRVFPLIGLWLVIVQTAIATYAEQVLNLNANEWNLACASVCLCALGANHLISGIAPRWFQRALVVNVLCMTAVPMLESDVAVLVCLAGVIAVLVGWRKRWLEDFFPVTAAVGVAVFGLTVLLAKHALSPSVDHFEMFFILGGFIALSVGGAVSWLRSEWSRRQC